MKTTVTHLFAPLVRGDGPIKGDAQLEATIHFHPNAVWITVTDYDLAEGLELVAEVEIVCENGLLLLRATTNRSLELGQDGEAAVLLYDPADPYPRESDEP